MYEKEIDAGVTLLDRDIPDWATRINLDTFDMKALDGCVLCQLFGGYTKGLDKLGIPLYTVDDAKCGFDLPQALINDKEYKLLTEEWTKRVRDRL
jgi:hypothetical protein